MRGKSVTRKLWGPASINISNGGHYWAKTDNTLAANSASVPAGLEHWFEIQCASFRYVVLTFYSRIAAVTSESGATGHADLRPIVKGIAARPTHGTGLPARPPEVGLTMAQNDAVAAKNQMALAHMNPLSGISPYYLATPGGTFARDFLLRDSVAAATGQEEMNQAFVVPMNQNEEPAAAVVMFTGDGRTVTPISSIWLAFKIIPGRSLNATYHADTGLYVTMER